MHICLASIHPRALSGQIEGLTALASELEQLGHTTQIITVFGDNLLQKDRLKPAAHDDPFLIGKFWRIGSILASLTRNAKGADVVHLNLPTPAFAVLGDLLQRLLPVPLIVGFEAHLAEMDRIQLPDLRSAPGFYLPRLLVNNAILARCAWHHAARYVLSSQHQASELRRLGYSPASISILPNLIDAGKLQKQDRYVARQQLDLPSGQIVGYIGHYHNVKGVDALVRSFRLVVRDRPDCYLALAWSGIGDSKPIERAIEKAGVGHRIIRLGRLPVSTLISAIDVLALPYRYSMGQNAFPALLLEAMAIGTPILTSSLPLLRELLDDERTALLVSPGEESAIAWGIKRLLDDKDLARAMIAQQHRLLAGPLNPKEIAKQYVHVYEQVCAGEAAVLRPTGSESGLRSPALQRTGWSLGQRPGAQDPYDATSAPGEGS